MNIQTLEGLSSIARKAKHVTKKAVSTVGKTSGIVVHEALNIGSTVPGAATGVKVFRVGSKIVSTVAPKTSKAKTSSKIVSTVAPKTSSKENVITANNQNLFSQETSIYKNPVVLALAGISLILLLTRK